MTDNVINLTVVSAGENFRIHPEQVLESALAACVADGWTQVIIIGEPQEGGAPAMYGSANAGESLILIERAKRQIVFPDDAA